MKNYAGIEDKYARYDSASIFLQPITYDGTSTWGKGADKSLPAFQKASENMELYDPETKTEVYKKGIHLLPTITEDSSPEKVFQKVYTKTKELLQTDKFLTFLGGEHSISIGIIKAFQEKYPNLTILHLDAHADLRPNYLGSQYNHACALHQASKTSNLIQIGIRSLAFEEKKYLKKENCFWAEEIYGKTSWMQTSIDLMGHQIYLTFDLDVLDPGIMPATGTPEPGGLDWNTTIKYLKKVFSQKEVVGFDLVEFAPLKDNRAPDFLVAKLYYKMLSYKFKLE